MQQEIHSPDNFSSRLAQAVFRDGRTKKRIAEAMGVHQSALSRWLAGSVPDRENLSRLCRVLNVTVQDLLPDEPLRQTSPPVDATLHEEPVVYDGVPRLKVNVQDIARLVRFDLDTITHTQGEEQLRAFLTLRDVHLPCLAKLLNVD